MIDPVNQIANLVSGDTIHFFRPQKVDGKIKYRHIATRALSANATHLSGITTITPSSVAGIVSGDLALKRHLSTAQISSVGELDAEAFGNLTAVTDPDGVQLVQNGMNYPYREYVWAHWKLGGSSSAEGARAIVGDANRSLNIVGTPNTRAEGYLARPYACNTAIGSGFELTSAASLGLYVRGTSSVQYSFWYYHSGAASAFRALVARATSSATNGYFIYVGTGTKNLTLIVDGGIYTLGTFPGVGWHHVLVSLTHAAPSYAYINGVIGPTPTISHAADPTYNFYVGTLSGYTSAMDGARMLDLVAWSGAPMMTSADAWSLYNGGLMRVVGQDGPVLRYTYENAGLNGQKYSIKAGLTRTTTAVRPMIFDFGSIKTS